jgi:hypothetical protein
MPRVAASLAAVVVLTCALAAAPGTGGIGQASRTIDRTISCSVVLFAGVKQVQVNGTSGTRSLEDRSKWRSLASVGAGDKSGTFMYVAAGNPLAPDSSGFVFPPHRLSIRVNGCRNAPSIPFSRRGLAGGRAGRLGDEWDCAGGNRVTVRVRAIFRSPTRLRPVTYPNEQGRYLRAAGTVTQAFLAVRAANGKPLAYGDVAENGRARLLTAKDCSPD